MNKRITSLLLCFVMVFPMLATAVPALAAPPASSCTYSIEADKTSANPGDTINFTIYMQQTGNQNTLEGTLVIPDGLTFVTGSGKLEDGIKTTLGWDSVEWTPVPNMILNGFGSESFTGTDKLAVMKFQCTVDNDATAKDYEVTLIELVADDENYETKNPTCIPATITVTAAPVAVTGVTIDETLSVNIGQTKTPSFTVAPAEATNKTVSFTSDNPAVATVNATTGAVTGVSKGTAIITVKTADGNFTDTCTVTVSCAHTNKSTVPAKDSTCTEKGWDEYKECDDCGQLFNTSDVEIDEIPFLNLANHTGGTATCTAQAICSVCHQPYGNYAAHSYTAETKKAEALKTAGNCRDKAVYYYSCSVCGNVEHNDAHTFEGDKDANTHVGTLGGWVKTDPDKHWKEYSCCGATVEEGAHVYDNDTDTTCNTCDYIRTITPSHTHSWAEDWSNNETHHWHECTGEGCDVTENSAKDGYAAHTYNQEIATTEYKVSDATCTAKATYYKSCICGATGTETFESGEVNASNHAGTLSGWKTDSNKHWKEYPCCGATVEEGAHVYDNDTDTTCNTCGYIRTITPSHTHSWATAWSKDDTHHWHECTGEGCDVTENSEKNGYGEHDYDDDADTTCNTCDYTRTISTTTYTVTVNGSYASTTGAGEYAVGETVNISAGSRSGYTFDGWTSNDATITNADSRNASFVMPDKNVTVTANWIRNTVPVMPTGPSTYAIKVEKTDNGDVTSSHKTASKGTTVTLTVEPDKGYTLETITVTDKNGDEIRVKEKNGKYTFTMPASKVYVEATFMEDNSMLNFFVDVPADAYYYDAVLWAAENGITGGTDDTHFAPNATCTRAQAVTFLWRAAGSPAPKSDVNPFTDVKAGSYYYDAVLWAVENGITKGTSDTTFSPDVTCSRAQIVTFLWRANGSPAVSGNSAFTDVAADAYYAAAVTWAEKNDVTGGIGGGLFGSNNNCTRAQIVTFIYRSVK